jgi:phosphoglucosamine mutase
MKFGTDGVRGRAYTDLTLADCTRLARAVSRAFGTESTVVGRDTRESGPDFVSALGAGFAAEGVAMIDLGVAPTPEVAFLAADLGVAGIVVSASHNPWHDNGLKVFAPGGRKLTDDQQHSIESLLVGVEAQPGTPASAPPPTSPTSAVSDGTERYLRHVMDAIEGRDLQAMTVVLDCANGAASSVGPALFSALGARLITLHADPDGRNINHACGSTDLTDLRAAVTRHGADLGVALDGDADRMLAVAENGTPVDGDAIIALAAIDLQHRGRLVRDTVVVTVMSNLGFHRAMAANEIEVHTTPVGDRYVLDALDRHCLSLGGEQSGHVIFTEFATTGDGLLTGVMLADLLARSGRTLSDLASVVQPVPQLLENLRVTGSSEAIVDALAESVSAAEMELAGTGRVLLRASGTEPLVRVMVEADDEAQARRLVDRLSREVSALDGRRDDDATSRP